MNKPDVQRTPQSATPIQDQALSPKHGAAPSAASKAGNQSGALPGDHVCTDACTHEGATKGKSTTTSAPHGAKPVPAAAKGSNDSTARGI